MGLMSIWMSFFSNRNRLFLRCMWVCGYFVSFWTLQWKMHHTWNTAEWSNCRFRIYFYPKNKMWVNSMWWWCIKLKEKLRGRKIGIWLQLNSFYCLQTTKFTKARTWICLCSLDYRFWCIRSHSFTVCKICVRRGGSRLTHQKIKNQSKLKKERRTEKNGLKNLSNSLFVSFFLFAHFLFFLLFFFFYLNFGVVLKDVELTRLNSNEENIVK